MLAVSSGHEDLSKQEVGNFEYYFLSMIIDGGQSDKVFHPIYCWPDSMDYPFKKDPGYIVKLAGAPYMKWPQSNVNVGTFTVKDQGSR
jgi:hypothetical protein